MKKKKERDSIGAFQRQSNAARRVGLGSMCECEEERPDALIAGSKPAICASCKRNKIGRSPFDKHHPAGQANHPATVLIPVNDHRAILNPAQYDWPEETLRNQFGSPILAAAASIRGYCETSEYLADNLLLPNAKMLEELDRFLTERLGPDWWRETNIERFAPKRKPKRK